MVNWFKQLFGKKETISSPLDKLPYHIRKPEDMHADPTVWTHPDGFVIRNGPDIWVADLDGCSRNPYCTWRQEQYLDCLWVPVVFKTKARACKVAAEQKIVLEEYKEQNTARLEKWLRDQQHVPERVEC